MLLGELQLHFNVNISSQLQCAYVLTCSILLRQTLQRLIVVERISRQLQRVWEGKRWKNSWVLVAGKRLQAESFPQNLHNKPVGPGETFSQSFLINYVEQFSVRAMCDSFCKSWRQCPSIWRCFVVPRLRNLSHYLTRRKLHKVGISNWSKLLCWFETDVLGFETELCQGSWLRNSQYQRK